VTRRHHPLQGNAFEVLAHGRERLCIRLKDGTPMYLPRRWTDADGLSKSLATERTGETVFTVESLRDLGSLVDAFLERR
jgi:uncharacterized protein DUF5372